MQNLYDNLLDTPCPQGTITCNVDAGYCYNPSNNTMVSTYILDNDLDANVRYLQNKWFST